jgi:hypothetical protein
MDACSGSEINDVIGSSHCFLIVFDHHKRIASRTQHRQRGEQLFVVAGVQANGRLVEHIQHSSQIRTQLRRQPDAPRFAAGKSGGAAAE